MKRWGLEEEVTELLVQVAQLWEGQKPDKLLNQSPWHIPRHPSPEGCKYFTDL